jgi:hypothetical protein
MSYTDYIVAKLLVMVFLAFCWGVYRGITGQPLERGQPDSQAEKDHSAR